MRVLIIHSEYLSGPVSGENQVVAGEASLLSEASHGVAVFSPLPQVESSAQKITTAFRAVWAASTVSRLIDLMEDFRPDVVHFHNLFPTVSPAAIREVNRRGVACVMTLHNFRMMCLPATLFRDGKVCELCVGKIPWSGVALRCYRASLGGSAALGTSLTLHRFLKTFDMVDLLMPVSDFVRNKHLEANLFKDRMVVKPNFSESGSRRSGPGKHFLYAGYLEASKGIGHLAQDWASDLQLVVAGGGPLAGQLGGLEGVVLAGPQDRAGMERLFSQTRAVMVPSRSYESAPRVILEAYSAGIPVIVSRIGGVPELVIDRETGLIVDPDDDSGWRAAVARLSEDSESERMGANAYELWKQRYSPEVGLKNLEDCYQMAIEHRARG